MIRFFVEPSELSGDGVVLTGDNANHAKVLRLKAGEEVLVCDGEGQECLCQVVSENYLQILQRREAQTEPALSVRVFVAFPKADKLEHVIQKATELGACEIVAFPSTRCVFKSDDKSIGKKLERWQKIALSAAQQSGRGRIPKVTVLSSYASAIQMAAKAEKAILLYENEQATTLKMALEQGNYASVSLISGPEGGFEEKEVAQAQQAGISICTLGKRILRCETAPLCALSAVMYASGEF